MKSLTLLTSAFLVTSTLLGLASGDTLRIQKCICASETEIGYKTTYTINGDTTGLPDSDKAFYTQGTLFRNDYEQPRKVGLLCTAEYGGCRRVPSISQYFSYNAMTPRNAEKMCHKKEGGNEVCMAPRNMRINGHHKSIPSSASCYHYITNTECAESCRSLWPGDNSTYGLCEFTETDPNHPNFRGFHWSGASGFGDEPDACWGYESHGWEWQNLKSYRRRRSEDGSTDLDWNEAEKHWGI